MVKHDQNKFNINIRFNVHYPVFSPSISIKSFMLSFNTLKLENDDQTHNCMRKKKIAKNLVLFHLRALCWASAL